MLLGLKLVLVWTALLKALVKVVKGVSLSLSPPLQPQRHRHRAPHMTRALGFRGFGELRRLPPPSLSLFQGLGEGICCPQVMSPATFL